MLKDRYTLIFVVLLVLVAIGYLATMSHGLDPALSGPVVAEHLGLTPFPPMSHPVWELFVRGISLFPPASWLFLLNLSSVVFAIGTLLCFYALVRRWCVYRFSGGQRNSMDRAKSLGAIVAVAALAFSIPFWAAATRAHPITFDLLLLLGALLILQHYLETRQLWRFYLFCLLWGIGITEYATFIVISPIVAIITGFYLWKTERLKPGIIAAGIGCVFLGLLVYLLKAWTYTRTPAFEWRNLNGFFHVLWYLWVQQYWAITRSTGATGWILIFMCTLLPWIFVSFWPSRVERDVARYTFGHFFLYTVLSALAFLVIFNIPPAPWTLLRTRPFLVAPYVVFAAWVGYLTGLWYMFINHKSHLRSGFKDGLKAVLKVAYPAGLVLLLVTAAVRNFAQVDTRPGTRFHQLAERVVENLDSRGWLITDGILHNHIAVEAARQQADVKLLNLRYAHQPQYMRYVGTLFDDLRLKGLADIGLAPLLREWFERSPDDVADNVAVVGASDLWALSGFVVVPHQTLFLGTRDLDEIDANQLYKNHREFWDAFVSLIKRPSSTDNLAYAWTAWSLQHLSKIANNTGVLLEDKQKPLLAFEMYQLSRSTDSNNVSALLNGLSVATREELPEQEALGKEYETFIDSMSSKLGVWGLSRTYGYVRHPEAYANRGLVWAMSGKPNIAIHEIQRAIEIGEDNPGLQMMLASLYYASDMPEESRSMYVQMLDKDPENKGALLGLARLAIRRNDFDVARDYIERLKELQVDPSVLQFEESVLEVLSGNPAQGKEILERLVKENPEHDRAWAALALLAMDLGDSEKVEQAVQVLASRANQYPKLLGTLARIEIQRGNIDQGRMYLERLTTYQPNNIKTLEQLLRLDVLQRRREDAEERVERILNIDSRNALANYIFATLQISRGKYALAEQSLWTSLESRRSAVALNDLAWLLQRKGQLDRARKLAEESLSIESRHPNAWDTYGVILMAQGDLAKAEKAIDEALSLMPDHPEMIYHLALLKEKQGHFEESWSIAEPLLDRAAEMTPETYEELRELSSRLRTR